MNFGDYVVSLWLIPVLFQIILPLVLLCGWMVIKLPLLLFGWKPSEATLETSFAR